MAGFRNYPPAHGIRVPAAVLDAFVRRLLLGVGMDETGAQLVAGLLVATDARCVLSHGTRKLQEYLPKLRDGRVNPQPRVRAETDFAATAVIDGDGGLGHHACHFGMSQAIEKAKAFGVGTVTCYNHYHFGSAGKWSRMALQHDCIGLAISCHRFEPNADNSILGSVSSSPFSIAIPAGDQPAMVLDMGGMMPRGGSVEENPMPFFKGLGLGTMNVMLGGLLAGIWRPEVTSSTCQWESNQGAFLTAWDVRCFMKLEQFRAEMDRWIGRARQMQPVVGFDQAELPGGMEAIWSRKSEQSGIALSDEHRQLLEDFAEEAGEAAPFDEYESTRY
jgi:L-2-hydroxycarboxylate dehydrogenase (NAD+)